MAFFFNEKGKQWNRWKDKIVFKLSLNPSNFNADVLSLRYQSWSAFFSNIRNIPTPTAVPLESYTSDIISKAMWGARLQLFVDYFDYLFIFFFLFTFKMAFLGHIENLQCHSLHNFCNKSAFNTHRANKLGPQNAFLKSIFYILFY